MSAIALAWVATIKVGNQTAKQLLSFYASHNFHQPGFQFKNDTLVNQLETSLSSIQRAHKLLVEKKLLKKETRFDEHGRQLSNTYYLNIPQEFVDKFFGERGEGVTVTGGGCQAETPKGVTLTHLNNNNNNNNIKYKETVNNPELPDWLDKEKWEQFKQHRKEIKAPLSKQAEQINLNKLIKFNSKGHNVNAIIEETIANGWKSFFEPKGKQTYSPQNNQTTSTVPFVQPKTSDISTQKALENQKRLSDIMRKALHRP